MFIRFGRMHERDGETYGQTPHRPRLYLASMRGKNGQKILDTTIVSYS